MTSPTTNIIVKRLTPEQIKAIRDAEDKAFSAKTGADFGFKRMKGTPDWAKEILLANPPNKIYGRTSNCQRCVIAHEARMRGYDVIARPSWGEDDVTRLSGEWMKSLDYSPSDFIKCTGKTGDEVKKFIEDIMRSFGEGARAIVVFKWDINLAYGHAIVVQCRENGIVNFGDPQTREIAVSKILRYANVNEAIGLLRVDNLKFTDSVKRCCMNKE